MNLESSTILNDNSLQIEGYNLVRADHPNNVKRGGVCIYFRESLPVITIPYLKEVVLLELVQNNKKYMYQYKITVNVTNFCRILRKCL